MRAAFGAGATSDFTDALLTKLRDQYKMTEGHFVSPDLSPYADIAQRLKAHGMKPIYNVEMAVWVNTGMNTNYDLTPRIAELDAIKAAGWEGSVCEGISQKQVAVLHPRLPYYNEGGEGGEDVYASGSMYYRPRSMAAGNYHECYHKGVNYTPAISSGNQSTPNNMGLTLMMYTTGELYYPDPQPLITYIDSLLAQGIKINTILFWVGSGQDIISKLDGQFNYLWKALDNKYKFVVDGGNIVTETTAGLKADNLNVVVGDTVTFTATLMAGTLPIPGKRMLFSDGGSAVTDSNGVATYKEQMNTLSTRKYYAKFAGDASYGPSQTQTLTVTVGPKPVGQAITIAVTGTDGKVHTMVSVDGGATWSYKA